MSSLEFAEWMAYAGLEPFGEERADLRAGIIAATIANVHRPGERDPYTPTDFMPCFGPPPPQTPDHMLSIVEVLNAAYGGVDMRPHHGNAGDTGSQSHPQ
jgi:hypothetical protein